MQRKFEIGSTSTSRRRRETIYKKRHYLLQIDSIWGQFLVNNLVEKLRKNRASSIYLLSSILQSKNADIALKNNWDSLLKLKLGDYDIFFCLNWDLSILVQKNIIEFFQSEGLLLDLKRISDSYFESKEGYLIFESDNVDHFSSIHKQGINIITQKFFTRACDNDAYNIIEYMLQYKQFQHRVEYKKIFIPEFDI